MVIQLGTVGSTCKRYLRVSRICFPWYITAAEASTVPAYFATCLRLNIFLDSMNLIYLWLVVALTFRPTMRQFFWKQYVQPIKTLCNISLGAPAVTNAIASGWGTDWLNQFFGNCTAQNCTFDFHSIFIGMGQSVSDFEAYVTNFHAIFPTYPLWVTEFQFTGVSNADKQPIW